MGANATTFVPAYVAGEVLTAANLSVTNSGIPVFATTVTRDAAFGGTGEKTLAEGQFAYIEASNATQYYDGAAWQSVGVAPGLVLITTASPSAVQTFSINNCFSATYQNYKIIVNFSAAVGTTNDLKGRLRVSAVDATTNYATQRLYGNVNTAGAGQNTAGTDEFFITNYVASSANTNFISIEVCNPAAAAPTSGISFGGYADVVQNTFFTHTTSTAYDGITFITDGTSFTGTIRVYGYANS
jgi:hypothetical protein